MQVLMLLQLDDNRDHHQNLNGHVGVSHPFPFHTIV